MAAAISPETLTLASIVSVKIQSCVTKYEDEVNRRKKCVHGPVRCPPPARAPQRLLLQQCRR